MKVLTLALVLCLTQQGCAAYTVANTTTYIVTDKTIADHTLTAVVPNGDCATNNLFKGLYYCEIRDVSVTYNRNTF